MVVIANYNQYLMISRPLIFSLLILLSLAAQGIIVNTAFTNYTCLRAEKKSVTIIRGLLPTGVIDGNAVKNIKASNDAGFLTDVYMAVCPGKQPTTQVNAMVDGLATVNNYKLKNKLKNKDRLLFQIKQQDEQDLKEDLDASIYDGVYGNIWVLVDTNTAIGCSWQSKSPSENCDYVGQVLRAIENKGRSGGIYTNSASWKQIVGDNCTAFANYPLMYSKLGNESFDDWSSDAFGGWKQPTLKNYFNEINVCGTRFGLFYF